MSCSYRHASTQIPKVNKNIAKPKKSHIMPKNDTKKAFVMRILKHEEIIQAIRNNIITITPMFVPWQLHDNTYKLYPYCTIVNGEQHTPIHPTTTGLLAGVKSQIVVTENIWTLHPRLKLGMSFPTSLLKKATYEKIDVININNGVSMSLVFTPRYNFTLNSKSPIAKVYFLFDDDTNRVKEKSTENAILQNLQIISPICVAQNTEKLSKRVY